jgi:hypothetical protein
MLLAKINLAPMRQLLFSFTPFCLSNSPTHLFAEQVAWLYAAAMTSREQIPTGS